MFSELRKYRVGFTVAHQYLHQLEPDIRHAVLGNAGTIISFRVGAEDAPYIVEEFHERFENIDFIQLPNYRTYVKLMIDGTPSEPFSARTLPPYTRELGQTRLEPRTREWTRGNTNNENALTGWF